MSLSDDIAAGIDAAFTSLGDLVQTIQLRKTVHGAYVAGERTETDTDYPASGAVTERTEGAEDGTASAEMTLLLKPLASGQEPVAGDHLVIESVAYRVKEVEAIKPADTALAFEVKVVL